MQCFPEACAQTPAEQDGCYRMIGKMKMQMRSDNKFADGIKKIPGKQVNKTPLNSK